MNEEQTENEQTENEQTENEQTENDTGDSLAVHEWTVAQPVLESALTGTTDTAVELTAMEQKQLAAIRKIMSTVDDPVLLAEREAMLNRIMARASRRTQQRKLDAHRTAGSLTRGERRALLKRAEGRVIWDSAARVDAFKARLKDLSPSERMTARLTDPNPGQFTSERGSIKRMTKRALGDISPRQWKKRLKAKRRATAAERARVAQVESASNSDPNPGSEST